jgi:membrane protease subunit HflK
MMQSVIGNASKVMVDQKAGSSSLLYLPLDKLIQQSGAPGAPAATVDPSAARQSTPPAAESAVTLDPSRSREGMRNRERAAQ